MSNRSGRAVLVIIAALGLAATAAFVFVTLRGRPDAGAGTARVGEPSPVGEIVVQFPAGGLVPTNEWPDACRLLSDHDVKAVLPDATDVETAPLSVSTRTVEEFRADPSSREDEYQQSGRCTHSLQLPGERVNSSTVVRFRIVAVGDPDLIARYHRNQQLGRGAGVGGTPRPSVDECYLGDLYGAELVCRRGPVMFELGGSTTVLFREWGGTSVWRDEVLGRFATSAGAKLRWTA